MTRFLLVCWLIFLLSCSPSTPSEKGQTPSPSAETKSPGKKQPTDGTSEHTPKPNAGTELTPLTTENAQAVAPVEESPLLRPAATVWNDRVLSQSGILLHRGNLYLSAYDPSGISIWRYSVERGEAMLRVNADSMVNAFYWNKDRLWDTPPIKPAFMKSLAGMLIPDSDGRIWYSDWGYLDAKGTPVEKQERLALDEILKRDLPHLLPSGMIRLLARLLYPKASKPEERWIEQARRGLLLHVASPDGVWFYVAVPQNADAERVRDLNVTKIIAYNMTNRQFRTYDKLWPADHIPVRLIAEKGGGLFAVTEKDAAKAARGELVAGRSYVWKLEGERFTPVKEEAYLDTALRVNGALWLVEKSVDGTLWLSYREGDETVQALFPRSKTLTIWEHQGGKFYQRSRRAPYFRAEQVQELRAVKGFLAGRSQHNQSDAAHARSVFFTQGPSVEGRYVCPASLCTTWAFDGRRLAITREKGQVVLFEAKRGMKNPRVLRQPSPPEEPNWSLLPLDSPPQESTDIEALLAQGYLFPVSFLPAALAAWKMETVETPAARVVVGEAAKPTVPPSYRWSERISYLGADALPGVLEALETQPWKVFDTLRLLDEPVPMDVFRRLLHDKNLDDTQIQAVLLYLTERYGELSIPAVESLLGGSFVNLRVLAAQFLLEQTGRYPLGWFAGNTLPVSIPYATLTASLAWNDDTPENPVTSQMSRYVQEDGGLFGQCLARYHANYQEMNFSFGVELVPYGAAMEIVVSSAVTHQSELAECMKMAFIRGFGRIALVGGALPRMTGSMTLRLEAPKP